MKHLKNHVVKKLILAFAMLLLTTPVEAATPTQLASARSYFEGIYRRLAGPFDYRSVRYAPQLDRLMALDAACATASGGQCVIDSVPFCWCQDTDSNYRILSSAVTPRGSDGARVTIVLRNGGVEHYNVDLTLTNNLWFVADVHGPRVPSLIGWLQRGLPRSEAQSRRTNRQ